MNTFRNEKHGFEITLPEEWFLCKDRPPLVPTILVAITHGFIPRTDLEFSTGSDEYLNIVIEKMIPEPSPEILELSFKAYAQKEGFIISEFGSISIEHKEHAWVRYQMSSEMWLKSEVWFKKYMIVLKGKGYAITASCVGADMLFRREKTWNQIAKSFRLLSLTGNNY